MFVISITTLAISCSSVSMTPAINPCHRFSVIAGVIDTGDKFIAGVVDTGEQLSPGWSLCGVVDTADKHSFGNNLANFRKNLHGPNGMLRGLGKLILEKSEA
jgi:hypothetical protein